MNLQVTSVSKKEQKLFTTGAAAFVITQEDIRRSGATCVPEVLRLAPGVDVARLTSNDWAISIRGFNDLFANKVLVLVDGRSVFDPLFSGTYWSDLDIPLQDIERIEVIRGPGGTVWGANAVNGVINIITFDSSKTKGALLEAAGGTDLSTSFVAQYGGDMGENATYRAFARYYNVDTSLLPSGGSGADASHSLHEGFRADFKLTPSDSLMLQAEVKTTEVGELLTTVISAQLPLQATIGDVEHNLNADVLALWKHTTPRGDEISLQLFDNRITRSGLGDRFVENTADFDLEDHFSWGSRQDLVVGAGLRLNVLRTQSGYSISFLPENRSDVLASTFVQDEIRLRDSLFLTVGAKFEHNSYTGFESEPSAQLVWSPTQRHAFWASAARVVRQPSMVDTQLVADLYTLPVPGLPFAVLQLHGNPKPLAENARYFEAGYRVRVGDRLSIDAASFISFFRNARSDQELTPYIAQTAAGLPYLVIPLTFVYNDSVRTYGGEIFASWNATSRWRITPSYSLFRETLTYDPLDALQNQDETGASSPRNSFQLRSLYTLPSGFEWDSSVAYTSSIFGGAIPAYTRIDSRIGWHNRSLDVSLVGQNLLDRSHAEFADNTGFNHTMVPRSFALRMTWTPKRGK